MNTTAQLHDFVEAYEAAQQRDGRAELARFLPPREHPLYDSILRELVRVDLEYGWSRGQPHDLEYYRSEFPELFRSAESVEAVAYEDYRLRKQAGEAVSPEEYEKRYGISTASWPDEDSPAAAPAAPDSYSFERVARAFRRVCAVHERPTGAPAEQIERALGPGVEAELFRDLLQSDPAAAEDLAKSTLIPPRAGTDFLGFHLVEELGSGAFGRVFLARQADLAERLVALKVTACLSREPQTLARLQHPNIVPIYSLHVEPPYQAVCMPYLGATTFADVLQLLRAAGRIPDSGRFLARLLEEKRQSHESAKTEPSVSCQQTFERLARSSYTDAVLGMMAGLADGLAHAHERGILHRDLKPANVLLSDAGEAMLLDFNLAADLKVRASLAGAWIGGTLPYMAPECLEALSQRRDCADVRSDVYALGILLFELLTARHPFQLPRSRAPEAVAALLAERRQGPPRPRLQNPALSSATEAILRKCLEPDPARRYASARELSEDLGRQLQHRPLRHVPEPSVRERFQKWRKRHPRLGIAAVSVLVLLAVVGFFWARHQRLPLLEAHAGLEAFRRDLGAVQVHLLSHHAADRDDYREAAERCLALLARYRIPDQPDWREQPSFRLLAPEERSEVCGELGELLLLLARVAVTENAPAEALHWNELAATCYGDDIPTMLWRQRAELYRRLRRSADADALRDRVRSDTPPNARDLCLAAAELTDQGRFSEALPLLRQAVRRESHDFRIWFDLGLCQEHIGRDSDATASYTTCIALTRDLPQFYYRRGMVYLRTKQYDEAAVDFTEALRQVEAFSAPARADLYLERALAELALRRPDKALDDLNRAEQYPCPTRVFFIRAMARGHLGDAAGARRDREEGLRRTPRDEKSWSARGWARLQGEPPDREGALADFEQALSLNPRSRTALQNKAHLLAEHLERTAEAVTVLDRLLELAPDSVPARASRGVLHARLGDRSAALADARASLERDSRAATQYQVAGIYALTSQQEPRDRHEALALLGKALEQGYGRNLVAGDRDLDPLRTLPEFQRLIAAPR